MVRMKRLIFILMLALCAAGAFAAGQTMYVAVSKAAVKTGTGFFALTKGTLLYADVVTVTETDGKWSYITQGNLSGWVATNSLSKRKIIAKGSNFSADADELALAGKGFNSEVESEYKKSGKVNYSAVDAMERNEVSDSELLAFIKEGKLKGAD